MISIRPLVVVEHDAASRTVARVRADAAWSTRYGTWKIMDGTGHRACAVPGHTSVAQLGDTAAHRDGHARTMRS